MVLVINQTALLLDAGGRGPRGNGLGAPDSRWEYFGPAEEPADPPSEPSHFGTQNRALSALWLICLLETRPVMHFVESGLFFF